MTAQFTAPDVIETDRLILRPFGVADLPALLVINSDAAVTRHLGHAPWKSMTDAEAWYSRILPQVEAGTALEIAVVEKSSGLVIGRCTFFSHDAKNACTELGYVLGRAWWGRGLMREALTALIASAFRELGLRRLEARIEATNTASSGLVRRLGFVREGVLRERWMTGDQPVDAEVYGLRRNWRGGPAV